MVSGVAPDTGTGDARNTSMTGLARMDTLRMDGNSIFISQNVSPRQRIHLISHSSKRNEKLITSNKLFGNRTSPVSFRGRPEYEENLYFPAGACASPGKSINCA